MSSQAYRPYRSIERRKSRKIFVGPVAVGGDAPISVQTMTNTLTTDIAGTLAQINAAAEAGADIVRVSCPDRIPAQYPPLLQQQHLSGPEFQQYLWSGC